MLFVLKVELLDKFPILNRSVLLIIESFSHVVYDLVAFPSIIENTIELLIRLPDGTKILLISEGPRRRSQLFATAKGKPLVS